MCLFAVMLCAGVGVSFSVNHEREAFSYANMPSSFLEECSWLYIDAGTTAYQKPYSLFDKLMINWYDILVNSFDWPRCVTASILYAQWCQCCWFRNSKKKQCQFIIGIEEERRFSNPIQKCHSFSRTCGSLQLFFVVWSSQDPVFRVGRRLLGPHGWLAWISGSESPPSLWKSTLLWVKAKIEVLLVPS